MAEEEDPFGMGAPPLADAGFGDADAAAPPMEEAMPTFGEMAPPSDMGGMDMGGMDMGGSMEMAPPATNGMSMGGADFSAPSMEVGEVAKWRMERDEKVAAKAAVAREAEAAKKAEAKAALDAFYAERAEKGQKRAAENRAAEAAYVEERDAAMVADSWESVAKLVDLKEKAGAEVDTSRFRSILTKLKHS